MKTILLIITFLLLNMNAYADMMYNKQANPCPMTEQTHINITFNHQQIDLDQVKSITDETMNIVQQMGNDIGIDSVEMQSMNYNLHTNAPSHHHCNACKNGEIIYRLNGSMNFKLHPSDKAVDLMVKLNEAGYTGSLNVNKYLRCR